MAWTATVNAVTKNEGNVVATVQFLETDTNETFTRPVPAQDLTVDSLADYCQRVIVGLEERDKAALLILPGPVVLPRDSTDPDVQKKIVVAALADAFFVLLATVRSLQAQVEKGIIPSNDQKLIDATAAMKAAFLPEYASDPRFG